MWLRQSTLVVADQAKNIDLSQLRCKFKITNADLEQPQSAFFRIYNLSDDTANQILGLNSEFANVTFQVGYSDTAMAILFQGTIKQSRIGRESSIDSYVDILGSDGDTSSNWDVLNGVLAGGSTPQQRLAYATQGMDVGYQPDSIPGAILPRGKTYLTMAREDLRVQAASAGLTYFFSKGKIHFVPLDGFRPNEAVVLNAQTGMIGWPEQTEYGIKVRCLINPQLELGCKLQINNKDILLAQAPASNLEAQTTFENLFGPGGQIPLNADGLYRIYVVDHEGDTRENDWYSDIICLSIDSSGDPPAITQKYG